jgi:hypothetical protein
LDLILASKYKVMHTLISYYSNQDLVAIYWKHRKGPHFLSLDSAKSYIDGRLAGSDWQPPVPASGWSVSTRLIISPIIAQVKSVSQSLSGGAFCDSYFNDPVNQGPLPLETTLRSTKVPQALLWDIRI